MSHGYAKTPEFDPGASANGKTVAGGILGRIEASPQDVGLDESKLDLLRRSIEEDIARGHSDGSVLLIARHGKIVMHEAIGYSDRANNRKALQAGLHSPRELPRSFRNLHREERSGSQSAMRLAIKRGCRCSIL